MINLIKDIIEVFRQHILEIVKDKEDEAPDFRGIPTSLCPACDQGWFTVTVAFDDEDYSIEAYSLDAECYSCGALITVPTPEDVVTL